MSVYGELAGKVAEGIGHVLALLAGLVVALAAACGVLLWLVLR